MQNPSLDSKRQSFLPNSTFKPGLPGTVPAPSPEAVLAARYRHELEAQITAAGDRERRAIAHDLHDGMGQLLTGIALRTQLIQRELARSSPALAFDLAEIVNNLNEAMAEARQFAQGLDPVRLRGDGLAAALRELCGRTERGTGIRCQFHHDLRPLALTDGDARHLYRIAQEAMTNAIRHGLATHIDVVLNATSRRLSLIVHDNGIGFADDHRAGMGMRSMRQRASVLAGSLELKSKPQSGTSVRCWMPTRARKNSQPHE